MTEQEVLRHMRENTILNQARKKLSALHGRIEQAYGQRKPPSPIDVKRWEFEAVLEILRLGKDITL